MPAMTSEMHIALLFGVLFAGVATLWVPLLREYQFMRESKAAAAAAAAADQDVGKSTTTGTASPAQAAGRRGPTSAPAGAAAVVVVDMQDCFMSGDFAIPGGMQVSRAWAR